MKERDGAHMEKSTGGVLTGRTEWEA